MPDSNTVSATSLCVGFDLRCGRCGYNLRSLAWDAVCPECGCEVRLSIPPKGFLHCDRWNAESVRIGVILLIVAATLIALNDLQVILAYRYCFQAPRWIVKYSTYIWIQVPYLVALLTAWAAWRLSRPYRVASNRRWRRLGSATGAAAVISAFFNTGVALTVGPWGPSTSGVFDFIVLSLSPIAFLGSSVVLFLIWGCLLLPLDPHLLPRLRAAVKGSFLAIFMVLIHAVLAGIVLEAWAFRVALWKGAPGDWVSSLSSLVLWWHKYISAAAWIVLLFILWIYLRQLTKALAHAATAGSGTR